MRVALVNSLMTHDAAPPIMPIKLAYWYRLLSARHQVYLYDLDIGMYDYMQRDVSTYNLLTCVLGGYTFSVPLSAEQPFSHYSFECLATVQALLALVYDEDSLYVVLQNIAAEYAVPFQDTVEVMLNLKTYIKESAKNVASNDSALIYMPSPASVIPGLLFSFYLKQENPRIAVCGAGNGISVPEAAHLGMAMGVIDSILSGDDETLADLPLDTGGEGLIVCQDLDRLPMPCYDHLPITRYPVYHGLTIVPMETSRGCPYKCNFCSERMHFDHLGRVTDTLRTKSLSRISVELDQLVTDLKVSGLTLLDCTFNADLDRCRLICEQLHGKDILASGAVRADQLTSDLMDNLVKARFTHVIVGMESFSQSSVKLYRKGGGNYAELGRAAIPNLFERGIIPQVNILLCHPYEDAANVSQALEALREYVDFLEQRHIPFFGAPVGTVVINYPSAVYNSIMKDPGFRIVYHSLPTQLAKHTPPHVRDAVAAIPFKAEKLDGEPALDKMQFVRAVYDLWSKDESRIITTKVSSLSRHKELILHAWEAHRIRARLVAKQIELPATDSPTAQMLSTLNRGPVDIRSLSNQHGGNDFVSLLLTLSMSGIVNLERESP